VTTGLVLTIQLTSNFHSVKKKKGRNNRAEELFLSSKAAYPIERTLLTTGLVAAGMESLASDQKRLETPHLAVRYQAPRESTFWQN